MIRSIVGFHRDEEGGRPAELPDGSEIERWGPAGADHRPVGGGLDRWEA